MTSWNILGISVSNPNQESEISQFDSSLKPTKVSYQGALPVRVHEWDVPESFTANFLIKGLESKVRNLWEIELNVILQNGIPRAKKVSISCHGKSPLINIPYAERVEAAHLSLASTQLRELEALAVATVIRRWTYAGEENWTEIHGGDFSGKEVRRIVNEVRKRTQYRSLSDQFLKKVTNLFVEAKSKGERTNKYIGVEIARLENIDSISTRTVEKWVAEARKRGFLEPASARRNSSPPTKAVGKVAPNKKRSKTATRRKEK